MMAVRCRHVGLIDTGIGHDETQPVLHDHQVRPATHHLYRIRQYYLDYPRILADLGRQRDRPGRWHNIRQINRTALGFGDDLLRHHNHVAVAQYLPGTLHTGQNQRRQIVPSPHHRQTGKREKFQTSGHAGPRFGFATITTHIPTDP